MKLSLFAVLSLLPVQAWAASDLTLPGARWLGKANGFVCAADTNKPIQKPAALEEFAVTFESIATDYSLDNGLLKAAFVEEGVACRYSALILADNAAKTVKLVESVAIAADETSSCANGKALLDELLQDSTYLYWGRPKHVTIMIEESSAAALCGEGTRSLGIDFVLAGRID